jgi:hypothetical protein
MKIAGFDLAVKENIICCLIFQLDFKTKVARLVWSFLSIETL